MAPAPLSRNDVEKQAAYRERHTERQRVLRATLARLRQELLPRHRRSVDAGANWRAAILRQRADETLIDLSCYAMRVRQPGQGEELP